MLNLQWLGNLQRWDFNFEWKKWMFSFMNVYRRAAEIFIHFQHMQTKMKNDKYIKVVSALLVIMLYEIHHRIDALTLEPNNFNIFDVFSGFECTWDMLWPIFNNLLIKLIWSRFERKLNQHSFLQTMHIIAKNATNFRCAKANGYWLWFFGGDASTVNMKD